MMMMMMMVMVMVMMMMRSVSKLGSRLPREKGQDHTKRGVWSLSHPKMALMIMMIMVMMIMMMAMMKIEFGVWFTRRWHWRWIQIKDSNTNAKSSTNTNSNTNTRKVTNTNTKINVEELRTTSCGQCGTVGPLLGKQWCSTACIQLHENSLVPSSD